MKSFLTRSAPIALLALAAGSVSASAIEASYDCPHGKVEAQFSDPGVSPGSVMLAFSDGSELTLPQALSADGGRYVAGDTEFWIKGNEATLTRNGKSETCHTN